MGGSEKGDEGTSIKLHENGRGGLWQKQIREGTRKLGDGDRKLNREPVCGMRGRGPTLNCSAAKSESVRSKKSFLRGETAGGEPFFKERSHCQKLDLCVRESR